MTVEQPKGLDIDANRRAQKWTRRELAGRLAWELLRLPLFRLVPRFLWSWRSMVLRFFGARIGKRVHIHPTVRIAVPWNVSIGDDVGVGDGAILYSLGPISIGPRSTISQYAHLCAGSHDYHDTSMRLTKPPIVVGAEVWICADAFIGPGVTVGDGAIVGARAVAIRNVAPGAIVAGNPCQVVKYRERSGV